MSVLGPSRWDVLRLAVVACITVATGTPAPVQAQEVASDRQRLEAVLVEFERNNVPIDELLSISIAAESQELRRIVGDLARTHEEVRKLRDRYVDDYPPIQQRLATISEIERETLPRVVRSILAGLPGLDGA